MIRGQRHFPEELINALARGSCVPFVGAGVSLSVKDREGNPLFPNWKRLIYDMAEAARLEQRDELALEVEAAAEGRTEDFPSIAQKVKQDLGSVPWANLLLNHFVIAKSRVDDASLALPRAIWALGKGKIVTTNIDHVLEWSEQDVRFFDSAAPAELGRFLREQFNFPAVWHLHGEVGRLNQVILTSSEYEELYGDGSAGLDSKYKGARLALNSLLVYRQLLFIGYSLSDSHLVECLQKVERALPLGAARHFALIRLADVPIFEQRFPNINVIDFPDFGEPLLNLVKELWQAGEERQTYLRPDRDSSAATAVPLSLRGWQNKKERRLEDALINARVFNKPSPQTAGPQPWAKTAPAFGLEDPLVLAFVSGKGGVGKTMLATACASHMAESVETLLVDLDFFNRGLGQLVGKSGTGLPVPELPGIAIGADPKSGWELFRVTGAERLRVLSPRLDQLEEYNLRQLPLEELCLCLREWLDKLIEKLKEDGVHVRALVLDCHGTADPLSIAATLLAQHALLVVEPEPVTAQGTVRFLRQIEELAADQKNDVRVIFNRVPLGMSARQLTMIFERQMGNLKACSGLLAYFPSEDYLARSAEQHELITRDFPDSSLARRTRVWLNDLLGGEHEVLGGRHSVGWLAHLIARSSTGHVHWLLRVDTTVRLLAVGLVVLFTIEYVNVANDYPFLNVLRQQGTWFLTIWSAVVLFATWQFSLLRLAQAAFHRLDRLLAFRTFIGLIIIAIFGVTLGLLTIEDFLEIRVPGIKPFDAGPKWVSYGGLIACGLFFVATSFWRLRPRPIVEQCRWVTWYRWLLVIGYFLSVVATVLFIHTSFVRPFIASE